MARDDRVSVAKRVCGGVVRLASDARRVRDVYRRAQGCPEHILWIGNALGLLGVCARTEFWPAGVGASVIRPGADVQTDARQPAAAHAVAGLLAAPPGTAF